MKHFRVRLSTYQIFRREPKKPLFKRGAAPITLINGDKLIDLLIKNEIAVKNKKLDYFTVDNSFFAEGEDEVE